jgi:predicted DNA-binding protein (MmcQ/YjbR family)
MLNIESLRDYCLSKPGVTEGFPFDNETLVFKVMSKLFALTNIELFGSNNLKCDPEMAIELREKYDCVKPGYHMNKKHWNTVQIDGSIPDQLILDWVDHSYDLVAQKLSKEEKIALKHLL